MTRKSPDESAEPETQLQEILDMQGPSAAVDAGRDLLRLHYFNDALRQVLRIAYEACGQDEEGRRLFPTPRAPLELQRLRMTRQDNPELALRAAADPPSNSAVPSIANLDNARRFILRTPENFDDLPEALRMHPEFAARDTEILLPATRAVAYPRARFTANGTFSTRDFEVPNTNRVGHSSLIGTYFAPGLGWHLDLSETPEDLGEPVFVFQRHPMTNYYHLIIEQACHILTWKRLYPNAQLKILVRRNSFYGLVQQLLDLLDVDAAVVHETEASYMTASHLVRPDAALHDTSSATFLTAASLDYFDYATSCVAPSTGPKRIFISRRDTAKRGLSNEAALMTALEPLGFEPVVLDGMSLKEQIALFGSAEAVVGGHGAGLTNIGYCKPGTLVLEITKKFTLDRVRIFWEIAAARGLRYAVVCAKDAQRDHSTSFAVPIDEVRDCLAGLLP